MVAQFSPQSSHFATSNLHKLSYPTPFFLLDLSVVEHQYDHLSTALPTAQIFFAMKANPDVRILQTLHKRGSKFEIASANELKLLTKLGIRPEDILYSNPVKPWQDIKAAHQTGVRRFVFDSPLEIDKLATHAPGASVILRITVNDDGSVFPFAKKFGASPQEAAKLLLLAKEKGLHPAGLAFHVGSQATNPERWQYAIAQAGEILHALAQKGVILDILDIGGGFPVTYASSSLPLHKITTVITTAVRQLPYPVQLIVEPGRFLVGEAGVLVTSVIGRARRGSDDWLFLDVSAFHGMMESLLSNNEFMYPLAASIKGKKGIFNLTGHTCDSQDTMMYSAILPETITMNDRVYIYTTGAYTSAYASSFNGFTPPVTYYVQMEGKE